MELAAQPAAAELVRQLHEVEGFSYAQLGAVYGVAKSTVWRMAHGEGQWSPNAQAQAALVTLLADRWRADGLTRAEAELRWTALREGPRSMAEEVAWCHSWQPVTWGPAAVAGPGVGRRHEQAALTTALRSWGHATARLLLVTGSAGVGKTQLVAQVLGRPAVTEHFTDGIQWLSWAEQTPLARWRALGRQWGVAPPQRGSQETVRWWQKQLRPRLAYRRVLLVLDGVDEYADLDEWLIMDATVGKLLVTTRRVDLVSRRAGRARTQHFPVPGLERAAARQLVAERSGLPAAEVPEQLLTQLGGLPLALDIAGRLARFDGGFTLLTQQVARRPLATLAVLPGLGPADSVRVSFAASYQRLSAPTQQVLRELWAVPLQFTLTAAVDVCAGDRLAVGAGLRELVRAGIVELVAEGEYRWSALWQAYARQPTR